MLTCNFHCTVQCHPPQCRVLPCKSLAKKAAIITPIGQYSTLISFYLFRSVMKKYLMWVCLEPLWHESLLLFCRRMVLLLSWYLPWTWEGSLDCSTTMFLNRECFGSFSPTDITSVSVELTVLILILVEDAYTAPVPSVVYTPAYSFMSAYTACAPPM